MHCHCGTNNRVPRWTFTDPCKPEVRPGAREESASPAWLAAPAMNARDITKVYMDQELTDLWKDKSNKNERIFINLAIDPNDQGDLQGQMIFFR